MYWALQNAENNSSKNSLWPHTASPAAQRVPFESPHQYILSPLCDVPNPEQHTDPNLGFWTYKHRHFVTLLNQSLDILISIQLQHASKITTKTAKQAKYPQPNTENNSQLRSSSPI
jgi:hypothetical protein